MTFQPEFLTLDEVLEIHENQIHLYGGKKGVREMSLLESALAQPQTTFAGEYLHGDLFQMAAAYLYHLVQNHPFVDGNKRAGTAAAIIFLFINGIELKAGLDNLDINGQETELQHMVLATASGKITKLGIAEFFRQNSARGMT